MIFNKNLLVIKLPKAIPKRKAVKIIVPSRFVKEDILTHYRVEPEKITVIYEGYFLGQEHLPAQIDRFNIQKPFLLYVGAAYPHKNLESLIRVFKKLNRSKEFQLALVGSTDYFYDRLKKTSADVPGIIFTGYVSEGELSALYKRAAAFVFPSLYEGFGLPLLEAMACGLPIVSFNTGGIPELVEHKVNGYIAEYKNTRDLKIGIEYLLNLPPQETKKMRQYSTDKIKSSFTLDLMTDKYIQLYEFALSKFWVPLNEQY